MPIHFERVHGVILTLAAIFAGAASTVWSWGGRMTTVTLILYALSAALLLLGVGMMWRPNRGNSNKSGDYIDHSPEARLAHAEGGGTAVAGNYEPTILAPVSQGILSAAEELIGQYKAANSVLLAQDPPGRFHLAGEFSKWRDRIRRALDGYRDEIQYQPLDEKGLHRDIANEMEDCLEGARNCPQNESREDHLIGGANEPMAALERWLEDQQGRGLD